MKNSENEIVTIYTDAKITLATVTSTTSFGETARTENTEKVVAKKED